MSELERIERQYGSVAEYNRVRFEESGRREYDAEPDAGQQQMMSNYRKELAELSGTPSDLAKSLKQGAKDLTASSSSDDKSYGTFMERMQVVSNYEMSAVEQLVAAHSSPENPLQLHDGFPRNKPGMLSIRCQYNENSLIKYRSVDNLTLDQFMPLYRDIEHVAGYRVQPYYHDDNGNVHTVTGESLGELRRNEFPAWGVEDPAGRHIRMKWNEIERDRKAAEKAQRPSRGAAAEARFGDLASSGYGDGEQMNF